MKLLAVGCFFGYVILFFIVQQVIANIQNVQNVKRQQYLLFELYRLIALILITVGLATMKHGPYDNLLVVRLVGVALILLGIVMSMWAQIVLGRNWVGGIGLHTKHRLITHGPYRYIRHPLYSGMLVSGFGCALTSLNICYGLGSILFVAAYALRAFTEDVLLQRKFNRQFDEYASRTGAIFPKIRKRG